MLCLSDDWDQKKLIQHRYTLKDQSFSVVCGIWNGQPVKRQRLPKGQLLPDEMMKNDKPYYIFPIHHLQYFLGYFIVDPELRGMEQLHVKSWLASVSMVLMNWFFRNQLTNTVKELDKLSQTDIDMNKMKAINDRYGHAEGDFCLSVIADALKKSAYLNEICIRTGGDEFIVLAKHYDQEKEHTFIQLVREKISQSIQNAGKNYQVTVSIGCCRSVPRYTDSASIQNEAELFLKKADKAMYKEKKQKNQKITG